jgi:hypothetical protein
VAERGGATRVQELAGVDGYYERERAEGRKVVWEVAGEGVGSMVCSKGLFIGRNGLSRRWPGRVSGDVRRAKPGAAALGACWRGVVMASGHCGHALASSRRSASCREAEGKERGSGLFPPFLPCLTPRVGIGEAGDRQPGEGGSPRAWLQG